MAKLKPEIQRFVSRAEAVCSARDMGLGTLSKLLFKDRAVVIRHLKEGGGCSVVSFIEAEQMLAKMERDPNYTPPKQKQKPQRDRQAVSA